MKLSTINLLVAGVLETSQKRYEAKLKKDGMVGEATKKRAKKLAEEEANTLCIVLKTAYICEISNIDTALDYYEGTHAEDEFKEFRTSVVMPKLSKMKKGTKKNETN